MAKSATRNFGTPKRPKNPVGTIQAVKKPDNMPEIRKWVRGIIKSYDTEIKVGDGLYFYMGNGAGGYAYEMAKYPELRSKAITTRPVSGSIWGFLGDHGSYCRLIWLYPHIIDNLKKNTTPLKSMRAFSKADYKRMSLSQAKDWLEVNDKIFLDKYPESGMGKGA